MKKAVAIITMIGIMVTIGALLNPFDARMFHFHDDTQAARIQQMATNLRQGIIPPRLAPDFSYGLGFPVFNFYAPFSYWIATGLHLIGLPIAASLKVSFLLAIIVSFIAMTLFLRLTFGFFPSLVGGVTYASSLWFAVEIFVRGNLAECWFLALFPFSLYFMFKNAKKESLFLFIATAVTISFTLTSHNIFSLLSLGIFIAYTFLFEKRKRNLAAIFLGCMLASYFLIPAVLETGLTHASSIATKTNYADHFLCIWQIWKTKNWDFAGSSTGCENDGMPFTLGKPHIVLGLLGILSFVYSILRKKNKENLSLSLFVLFLGVFSIFLTTYQSSFIWNLAKPLLSLFQFPWRFLVFGVFMLGYFCAHFFDSFSLKKTGVKAAICVLCMIMLLSTSKKFFSKPWMMGYDEFTTTYISGNYIKRTVAYNVAEYLPRTVNYSYWRSFDPQIHPGKDLTINVTPNSPIQTSDPTLFTIIKNSPFEKVVQINRQSKVVINVHYFPFWSIQVDAQEIIPRTFDMLGRPVITIQNPSRLSIKYKETPIEQISSVLSLSTILFLGIIVFSKQLWNKLKVILK